MYMDHRIMAKVARILEKVGMSAFLMDANGSIILPENNNRQLVLPDQIKNDPSTPMVYGGVTLIGTDTAQPMYVCLQGDSEEVKTCAVLCVELINMLLRVDIGHVNREQSVRLMLRGEVEGAELESLAAEHSIPLEKNRLILYFYLASGNMDAFTASLQARLDPENDVLTDVGRHSLVVMHAADADVFEGAKRLIAAVESDYAQENEGRFFVGVSEVFAHLNNVVSAYDQARSAINIGRVYHSTEKHVFFYHRLLLERFLSDIPLDESSAYSSTIFNRKTTRLFNEEMLHTIECFFENSLNLSETARKLYIHRNTLVYRLEKVQAAIGLDLREFDDAVTFKLMLLLGKNALPRKNRL